MNSEEINEEFNDFTQRIEQAYRRGYRQGFLFSRESPETTLTEVIIWSHDSEEDLSDPPGSPCAKNKKKK